MISEYKKNKSERTIAVLNTLWIFIFVVFVYTIGSLPMAAMTISNTQTLYIQISAVAAFVFFMALPAFLLGKHYLKLENIFNIGNLSQWKYALFALLGIQIFIPGLILFQRMILPQVLVDSIDSVTKYMNQSILSLTDFSSVFGITMTVFIIAVIPALCEELFFRGILFRYLSKHISLKNALLISAFLFVAVHFNPENFIALFVIGYVLAFVYNKSGGLGLPVLIHFLNNAYSIILYKFSNHESETLPENTYYYILYAVMVLVGIFIIYISLKKIKKIEQVSLDN